jgi:hypothetical protein
MADKEALEIVMSLSKGFKDLGTTIAALTARAAAAEAQLKKAAAASTKFNEKRAILLAKRKKRESASGTRKPSVTKTPHSSPASPHEGGRRRHTIRHR